MKKPSIAKKSANVAKAQLNLDPDEFDDELDGDDVDDEDGDASAGIVTPGSRLQLIPHTVDARLVFRFEFGPAILAQVLEKIDNVEPIPLSEVTTALAPYPGFYQLFRNGESKYIGRTIRPVASRLREHRSKLRGRVPIEEITCRFLFVEDRSLVGLSEDSLISYFHPLGLDEWGTQGFGSKVTGHGRADQDSEWHTDNPPDLSWLITAGGAKADTFKRLVAQVARQSPITLSIPVKQREEFANDFDAPLNLPVETLPFATWVERIKSMLGSKWHIDDRPLGWYIVKKKKS